MNIAGELEVVKDAGRFGGAGVRDHRGWRVSRPLSVFSCRAAPRRAPPMSCLPKDLPGIAPSCSSATSASCRRIIPIPTTAWCARACLPPARSFRASCLPFRPTARRKARRAYDETLRQQYGAGILDPGVPLFHLALLGLGDDGHTASLLPGQPVLQERERWVAVVPQGRAEAAHHRYLSCAGIQRTDPVSGVWCGQARCPGPGSGRYWPCGRDQTAGRSVVAGGPGGGGDQGTVLNAMTRVSKIMP